MVDLTTGLTFGAGVVLLAVVILLLYLGRWILGILVIVVAAVLVLYAVGWIDLNTILSAVVVGGR